MAEGRGRRDESSGRERGVEVVQQVHILIFASRIGHQHVNSTVETLLEERKECSNGLAAASFVFAKKALQ